MARGGRSAGARNPRRRDPASAQFVAQHLLDAPAREPLLVGDASTVSPATSAGRMSGRAGRRGFARAGGRGGWRHGRPASVGEGGARKTRQTQRSTNMPQAAEGDKKLSRGAKLDVKSFRESSEGSEASGCKTAIPYPVAVIRGLDPRIQAVTGNGSPLQSPPGRPDHRSSDRTPVYRRAMYARDT